MEKLHKKGEFISNVAIIIVAVILGSFIVTRYFNFAQPKPLAAETREIKSGENLSLPETDWSKSGKTLILALSTTCRYCTESAAFYQRLSQQKSGRGEVRLIAVTPQPADEARRYLSEHKIQVDEIRQATLDSINVRGTSTLIMTDNTGTVIQSWVGKLPPEKETEVINRFLGERAGL